MSLLISLNQTGFDNLKDDRETIIQKIEELEGVLKELEPAYQTLKTFYEPKVRLVLDKSRGRETYRGRVSLFLPNSVQKKMISFKVDEVESYKGIDDERLMEKAKERARETLRVKYPTYFE